MFIPLLWTFSVRNCDLFSTKSPIVQSCAPRVVPVLSLPPMQLGFIIVIWHKLSILRANFEWKIVVASSEFSIISDEKFKITTLRHQQKKEKGYLDKSAAEIAQEAREAAFIDAMTKYESTWPPICLQNSLERHPRILLNQSESYKRWRKGLQKSY